MMRVGLLGTGRIGSLHAETVASHPASVLHAVSDIDSESASILAAKHNVNAKPADKVISDPNIDAILIATSTDTHSDFIEKATSEGKAILCEKPVDLSLTRAKECLHNVRASKDRIMIGFNRRFDPNFAQLKKSLDSDDIGKRELLTITSFDPAPPPISYVKKSGGLYRDMMIHDFDLSNFIMDELPETISAVGHSLINPETILNNVDFPLPEAPTIATISPYLTVSSNPLSATTSRSEVLNILNKPTQLTCGPINFFFPCFSVIHQSSSPY